MNILLAFAPFIAFAVVDRLAGSIEGLVAGALVSTGIILRDHFALGKAPKILEIGTVILFVGLALASLLGLVELSVMATRLCVDAGLLVIVLVSMALQKPFTIQYARETVPRAYWSSPDFLRVNRVITAVWALAFVVLVASDLLLLYAPSVPRHVGVTATILALVGAIKFTSWYPDRDKPTESATP